MKLKYGYSVAKSVLLSNSTCGLPPKDYFNILRSVNSDLPWTGNNYFTLFQILSLRFLHVRHQLWITSNRHLVFLYRVRVAY